MKPQLTHDWFWLAINGASVAASAFPCSGVPVVKPIPELLVGFKTATEQRQQQQMLLTAPIKSVKKYMKETLPRLAKANQVRVFRPANPQKPTAGNTIWQLQNDNSIQGNSNEQEG